MLIGKTAHQSHVILVGYRYHVIRIIKLLAP